MNERQFHFQDLPVERFCHIFKYLASHDLLNAFERLNRRFDIMLAQQPLCLPNNRQMSIQLYCHYLKKISSSLDADYHRFYCDQYDECFDFGIAIQVLNCLPQLHSLYLRLASNVTSNHKMIFNESFQLMDVQENY
ncbi:unnamed protein product [Rotaria magnacalcarata]|uniref:F-box domain-containing protein n=2 Tax=Rotaria magnacalcarata TaxID=392030 RepID=A0A8S2ZJA3_9BILA|nr:unnamed protein product [Rotaria magnacalcarata]